MDIREHGLSAENADKISLKSIDPSIELMLDLERTGEKKLFMDTLSKDLIGYMSNLHYCKVTYQNALRAKGFSAFSRFFYNECRQAST